jgi:hypothetical protein
VGLEIGVWYSSVQILLILDAATQTAAAPRKWQLIASVSHPKTLHQVRIWSTFRRVVLEEIRQFAGFTAYRYFARFSEFFNNSHTPVICHGKKLIFLHRPKGGEMRVELALTGEPWHRSERRREQQLTATETREL